VTEVATFNLPLDLIKPAVDAQVHSAVVSALGSSDKLIGKLVESVLSQKVNSQGVSGNGYGCDTPWLSWAVQQIIREAIQSAAKEVLAKDKQLIEDSITAEMRRSKSPMVRALVTAMVEGFADKFASAYRMEITFKND
jgi:hypothetical protein